MRTGAFCFFQLFSEKRTQEPSPERVRSERGREDKPLTPVLYSTREGGELYGAIFFRQDTQVKVRGHRIELGEAENVLLTHELIKSAVVVVEEDKSGLAAAVVLNEDSDCCDNKNVEKILHEYLGKKLPEYMVPGKILVMEQLPLCIIEEIKEKLIDKMKVYSDNRIEICWKFESVFFDTKTMHK